MKYAHIKKNGQLLGWYDKDIHALIPAPNVEVSDEAWQNAINNNHNKVNADGTTEFYDFRTSEEIKESAKISILAKIAELEAQQARPLREILIDSSNEFAKTKLENIDAQVAALRAQL